MQNIILIISLFLSLTSFAKSKTNVGNDNKKITFVHLGLIHNSHLDDSFNYPPSTLIFIVDQLKPDLICGEAVTEFWVKGLSGLYPFENRILEFAGQKFKSNFAPVDWRTSYPEVKEIFDITKKYLSKEQTGIADKERTKLENDVEEAMNKAKGPSFFKYIHTKFNYDSAKYHTFSERFYGDIPNGFWYRRNSNIVVNCYEEAKRIGANKVLVAYGAEHQYMLHSLLQFFPDAKSQLLGEVLNLDKIPTTRHKLPSELKLIFENDLDKLKAYVDTLPKNSEEKKELIEKRIPGLQNVISILF